MFSWNKEHYLSSYITVTTLEVAKLSNGAAGGAATTKSMGENPLSRPNEDDERCARTNKYKITQIWNDCASQQLKYHMWIK